VRPAPGLAGTPVQGRIRQLYRELAARGIAFRPHAWLALDWFSPDGVPGFAVLSTWRIRVSRAWSGA